jgi:hypothetical protein
MANIGEILTDRPYVADPLQPGGTGTAVTSPTQRIDERTGRFYFGCGHSVNNMEIRKALDNDGVTLIAELRCPVCGYLQRKISPFSAIYAPENAIIFA